MVYICPIGSRGGMNYLFFEKSVFVKHPTAHIVVNMTIDQPGLMRVNRKKIRPNFGFCPNEGGGSRPIPSFLNQNHMVILLGFCHNKGGVPQYQPFSPKKWDFFMKK